MNRGEKPQYTASVGVAGLPTPNVAVFRSRGCPLVWEGLAASPWDRLSPSGRPARLPLELRRIRGTSGEIVGSSSARQDRLPAHLVASRSPRDRERRLADDRRCATKLSSVLTASFTSKTLFVLPAPLSPICSKEGAVEDSPLAISTSTWMHAKLRLPASKCLDGRDEGSC